jgi:tetratricopeptide (TPR) repeat protein
MSRSALLRLFLLGFLIASIFTGCSRDPNVRKQKYLESGNRYRDQGKYREATIQYSNAIQLDPRFVEAHFQLAETYLKLQDWNHAYAELSRSVDLAPENYAAQVDLANLLIANRDLKQAKTHLDVLRDQQPNNPTTYEAWATYFNAQDNLAAAIQEMQKAINADPGRSESYLNLAVLQTRANLPDQAEINFKKAAALGPKDMNAQLALGGFYFAHNHLPEAEQQLKHAIDVDPKDPAPRAGYAQLLRVEGRKADVETFLQQTKKDLPDDSTGYSMLGDFYFAEGDLDKAAAEYASLYKDHPKDLKVERNYIQILILKDRLEEAGKLNDEMLKANPHDTDALVYRAQIQIHRNDAGGAIDSLQAALRNDADNGVAHYWLGKAFDLQHNDSRAEAEWRDAVRLKPELNDAQLALANLEMQRGDYDALTQSGQLIIANAPQSPEGYLLRAVAEMNRQRYADAEQDLRKIAELAPASAVPYVQTGNLHLLQKQYAEALASYQKALEKDPASTEGLQGLMKTYLALKQPELAIAAARAQIAKAPSSSGFYDLLGSALFQKNDSSGAEAAFRKAIDLDHNNSDALLKLAQVQAASGSVSQALATYQQSIKDHPSDISFYILAGELYESQSNWAQARDMHQKALAIKPDDPLASNNLAYVMLQQGGNVDVALAMAQTARRGMPNSSNAADTLGWAYFQKGVYQSAIDMFQESLRLSEKSGAADDPTVHYHLGLAYEKANQPKLARQQLERALKISPNFNDARKALSELRG